MTLPDPSDPTLRPVGNTPLVEVEGVFAKLECVNPCGSIKDRIADYILRESRARGLLQPGQRIVEATSGNTGIAFAWFARALGHPITIVMPENMTAERKRILRELGAELVLCSEEGSFAEAAEIRDRLASDNGWFNPDQFSNPMNVECHRTTTAEEILEQVGRRTDRLIDVFVAGIGTGGTLIGVGSRLREVFPGIRLVAVEPSESAVMSGGEPGRHRIYGIGDGFIPAIAGDGNGGRSALIDEVEVVDSTEALAAARGVAARHGLCVGISAGANLIAAWRQARGGRSVVTILPDGYSRYQSEGLVHCRPGACPWEHDPVVGSPA